MAEPDEKLFSGMQHPLCLTRKSQFPLDVAFPAAVSYWRKLLIFVHALVGLSVLSWKM